MTIHINQNDQTMKLSHILLLAAASIAPLAANAQQAQRLSATKANDYGLVYSLPKTMLKVTLEAELTVKKPGEFYRYAPKYLNVSNPITKESHSVKLKGASISSYGIPDPEETFSIQFKAGYPVYVTLDEAGLPLSINTEEIPEAEKESIPEAVPAAPTPLETPAARQVISEEMLQSQSTAKRAELAAQAIFALRQTRSDLISGQADNIPPDGKSLQLMLDNLQAQEEALTAMFLGTTSVSTQVESFIVNPDALVDNDKGRVTVARLSAVEGIVDREDLSGSPVYLDLSAISQGEMPVNEKGQTLAFPKNGIPYCIPGELQATVVYDGETYASRHLAASQLGITYGLAPNSFTDKKAPIYIIYDRATGGILRQGPAIR